MNALSLQDRSQATMMATDKKGSYCFLSLSKSSSQQSLPLFLLKNYILTDANHMGGFN